MPGKLRGSILVVDDTKANIDLIDALLNSKHDVVACVHPAKAIEVFNGLDIEAVIIDYSMHPLNGYEVARSIRSLDRGKTVPIMLVSAIETDPAPGKLREAEIDSFMPLPLDLEAFGATLEQLIAAGHGVR